MPALTRNQVRIGAPIEGGNERKKSISMRKRDPGIHYAKITRFEGGEFMHEPVPGIALAPFRNLDDAGADGLGPFVRPYEVVQSLLRDGGRLVSAAVRDDDHLALLVPIPE